MIHTIHLHGALGLRFERQFRLSVASPAEAIRALSSQLPGFEDAVGGDYYQVVRGHPVTGLDLDPHELHFPFGADEELHIMPRVIGAKRDGLGKVILGTLLLAASFVYPGSWAATASLSKSVTFLETVGTGLLLQGISRVLSPQKASNYENRDQPTSALFGSATNISTPGVPVPLLVGECEVGSVVVSASIHVEDRASDA
jgi:predicted phage tail protein